MESALEDVHAAKALWWERIPVGLWIASGAIIGLVLTVAISFLA